MRNKSYCRLAVVLTLKQQKQANAREPKRVTQLMVETFEPLEPVPAVAVEQSDGKEADMDLKEDVLGSLLEVPTQVRRRHLGSAGESPPLE